MKNFTGLVRSQLTKRKGKIICCKRCFAHVSINRCKSINSKQWLDEHIQYCKSHKPVEVILPSKKDSIIKFDKISYQYETPICVYLDFESTLIAAGPSIKNTANTTVYQHHNPNSYSMIVKSNLPKDLLQEYNISTDIKVCVSENPARDCLDTLKQLGERVCHLYSRHITMKPLTIEEEISFRNATSCALCCRSFSETVVKCKDHDRLTGLYRMAACRECNIKFTLPNFIPIFTHNASRYDNHFIVKEIPSIGNNLEVTVLAETAENFKSIAIKLKNGYTLRFLDSIRFLPDSLENLALNASDDHLIETKKLVSHDKLHLVRKKGVYCYDYIDSNTRFNETKLPPKHRFFNKLNDEHITDEQYIHAQNVWDQLHCKTLLDYHLFYLKLDTSLLCDIFEQFRKMSREYYGLDPTHFYSSPGLAWSAMLKKTNARIELISDINQLLMVEKGVRGGMAVLNKRYACANNPYLEDYDFTQPNSYLLYIDFNNLYGFCLKQKIPVSDFKYENPDQVNWMNQPIDADKGYILEVDVSFPENTHDQLQDVCPLPDHKVPPGGKVKKLIASLEPKERYVVHYVNLQQATKLGVQVTKVHKVLSFTQSDFMKEYIDFNTAMRMKAKTKFEKDFFKFLINSVFGKTIQSPRKINNYHLVTNINHLNKLVKKTNFREKHEISEGLVGVLLGRTHVKLDKPIQIGMTILELSKYFMTSFFYDVLKKKYGDKIHVIYSDTDSYFLLVYCRSLYSDLKAMSSEYFDFSDYPKSHPLFSDLNKKRLGYFKDELFGDVMKEFVGLKTKQYAYNFIPYNKKGEKTVMKCKGVKKSCLKQKFCFEDFKRALFHDEKYYASFNLIKSRRHNVSSVSIKKLALSNNDNKRVILENKIDTLPYGHYKLKTDV